MWSNEQLGFGAGMDPAPPSEVAESLGHGHRMAVAISNVLGDDAGQQWYHEHEQYPSHARGQCPLPSLLPEDERRATAPR